MFSSYLPELADRIKEVAKLAVESIEPNIEVLDYPDNSGHTPYFSLQLGSFAPANQDGFYATEEYSSDTRTFLLHLVIAPLTAGAKGEKMSNLYALEELIIYQFKSNRRLISALYPNSATYLNTDALRIDTGTGARFINMGGTDNNMLVSTYTITVSIHTIIDED